MSAIIDDNKTEAISILFAVHAGFDTLDVVGPLEVFQQARHDVRNSESKAFDISTCGATPGVTSTQDVTIKVDMDFEEAQERIDEFDILVIPGGNGASIQRDHKDQPVGLIKAFTELQKKDPSKERTLFSVCTGSLFLASAGVLQGLAATTHPAFYTKLESLCQMASLADTGIRTDVMEERYVVNNARFDLGENLDENPFILEKRPRLDGRRKSSARKGSDAFKMARRRESLVKRANMPLGGLRVITAGGITSGFDAALYLVAALVSVESATWVANHMQYVWQKGVTVDAIDV